jgi:hypothetical protein
MKDWQFDFIVFLLIYIVWLITSNVLLDIIDLLWMILLLYDMFKSQKALILKFMKIIDFEIHENNLIAMNYYGREIEITPELKKAYKKWKLAEDEFYSKI